MIISWLIQSGIKVAMANRAGPRESQTPRVAVAAGTCMVESYNQPYPRSKPDHKMSLLACIGRGFYTYETILAHKSQHFYMYKRSSTAHYNPTLAHQQPCKPASVFDKPRSELPAPSCQIDNPSLRCSSGPTRTSEMAEWQGRTIGPLVQPFPKGVHSSQQSSVGHPTRKTLTKHLP